jgi:cell wall-associated NlpC family hydrolase
MRKDASHTSELVSELLFNDIYKIIEESDEWLKIQCMYDSYEGWIRKLQHHEITDNEYKEYISKEKYIVNTPIVYYDDLVLSFGSKVFENIEGTIPLSKNYDSDVLIESAFKMMNVPYRWGGKSFSGIDCSGLAFMSYYLNGVVLWRDADTDKMTMLKPTTLEDIKVGDLIFFPGHVAISLGGLDFIHATAGGNGRVSIERLGDRLKKESVTGVYTLKTE